jgi:hypothetical protein
MVGWSRLVSHGFINLFSLFLSHLSSLGLSPEVCRVLTLSCVSFLHLGSRPLSFSLLCGREEPRCETERNTQS